jgi:hypothetical protein
VNALAFIFAMKHELPLKKVAARLHEDAINDLRCFVASKSSIKSGRLHALVLQLVGADIIKYDGGCYGEKTRWTIVQRNRRQTFVHTDGHCWEHMNCCEYEVSQDREDSSSSS